MIQVFFNNRGSGKTKALIDLANGKVGVSRGNMVYIDDDSRPALQLDKKIRFITTKDFKLIDYNSFYGFLCGILSKDYDVDNIFIDGLSNIIRGSIENAAHLFFELEKISKERGLDIYININSDNQKAPDFIKKFVA